MNKRTSQSGFAHLVIVLVLALALVGALGFIFWQNFINKNSNSKTDDSSVVANKKDTNSTPTKKIEYKTFTTDKYNISFQYPSTWSVEATSGGDASFYVKNASIKNASGESVAEFDVGMQLGGTCDVNSRYTILEAESTKYVGRSYSNTGAISTAPVALSYSVIESGGGAYGVHYGLSETYINQGESGTVCPNTFYYVFHPNIEGVYGISFGNSVELTKQFSSLDAAKQYLKSDEYAQVKKMILSLNY